MIDADHPGPGVGILGGGMMAAVHARAARTLGARVLAIAASSPESSVAAGARLGISPVGGLADLLDNPAIDIVHVCTPNALHHDQVIDVLAAGKHVVCEKPLATALSDADTLLSAAHTSGRVATVPFVYRFHPVVREARARIAAGEIGDIYTISASYLQDWLLFATDDNWRVAAATGGPSRAFGDIGSHLVDLIEFVTGQRISRLTATIRTFFDQRATNTKIDTEDAVSVAFELEGGAIGTILVSQLAAGRKNRPFLEVSGALGSLRFDLERPEELWLGSRTGTVLLHRDPQLMSEDARRLSIVPAGHPQGYQDAFSAFIQDTYAALHGADPAGLPRFQDGHRAVELTEAVLSSARQSQWVHTPPNGSVSTHERIDPSRHPLHRPVGGHAP